jgi:hypothetical protein
MRTLTALRATLCTRQVTVSLPMRRIESSVEGLRTRLGGNVCKQFQRVETVDNQDDREAPMIVFTHRPYTRPCCAGVSLITTGISLIDPRGRCCQSRRTSQQSQHGKEGS